MKFYVCVIGLSVLILGCGKKKEEDKFGNVKAQFLNNTAALTELTTSAPTELLVKLKYIIVVQDKKNATAETGYNGDNSGNAIRVWVNPKCTSTTVNTDGTSYSDMFTDDQCESNGMGYFDLNRTTSAVNTDLNSQAIQAPVGEYKYVTMAFLGEGAGGKNTKNNVKWAHSSSGTTTQEYADFEVEFSAKFDTPISVGEGQTIKFNLNYDLVAAVKTGLEGAGSEKVLSNGTTQPGTYDDCASSKSVCFNMPTFTLTVTN